MLKHGKQYLKAAKKVEKNKFYSVTEAVKLVKETSYAKLDATVEVASNLSVDPKQADQQIHGALVLSNGTGRTQKVIISTEGPQAEQVKETGTDEVGSDKLAEKIQNGYLDFDVVVATLMIMVKVGRLDHVLGPKDLIPNPKTGTAAMDVKKAVENVKAGQVEYRVDKQDLIHASIGKVSSEDKKLAENFTALGDVISHTRPASTEGRYVKSAVVSAALGPGIHLDLLNVN